jgi:hypothetical protein
MEVPMKKCLVVFDKIKRVKDIYLKKSVFLLISLFFCATFAEAFNCNIQTIKETTNSQEWSYLWSVASVCGNSNSNNLSAHLRFLDIDPDSEHRAIAKQAEGSTLDRFFIIIVSGRRDNFTNEFVPEKLILEIANLQYLPTNPNDPFDQLETGFFIIEAELSGEYIEGFHIENGTSRRLAIQFALEMMEYIRTYWQEYFDSTTFVEADNELSQ